MKIVVLDGYLVNHERMPWKPAEVFPDLEWYDQTPPELVLKRAKQAEAVFVNRVMLGKNVLEQCPKLRFIGVFGTGYNVIDLAAANRLGITVCNVPEYSTFAVAQNTVALLLEIVNKTGVFDRLMKAGGWKQAADPAVTAISTAELYGKTVGILGYGDIGKRFAAICAAMGMQVLAYRRHPEAADGVARFVNLDTLRRESDVLSVHCPLTDETRGLVGRSFLAGMKRGAILLNTARGAVLDETAVAEALENGTLSAVGLDVYAKEPAGADHPLVRHPRCVATPHVSWSPQETRKRLLDISAENLFCFLNGTPQNVVNTPQIEK